MQKFIGLKWHTVPLTGKLERLPDGDKTIPYFEKKWKEKYSAKFNNKITAIGGAITGKLSNIIAIDCDNPETFSLFQQLDPDYRAIFYSKGKYDEPTGTFIYEYDEDIATFSPTDDDIALDVYSDGGFVYLPTKGNKTKEPWDELQTITPMPYSTKLLLKQLQKKVTRVESYTVQTQSRPCLAPLLTQFVGKRGEFMPSLFKVITPRIFRTEEQYQKYGYLHPNAIPDGRGSEYLSKVSAILGADESVSQELYVDTMLAVNSLFDSPMEEDRFDRTIMTPMLEGNAAIDGKPIWAYNEHWSEQRYTVTTKHGLIVDLGFDDQRNRYYYLDMTNEQIKSFARDTDFVSFLDVTVTSTLPKKVLLKKKLPIIRLESSPAVSFGFCRTDVPQVLAFNSFKPSPELSILHNPEDYEKFYKPPVNTLKYLECLVPNDDARTYLLQFIKRKLTYFEYSPVILYFLGKPGSGKDTFVSLLANIIGNISRPKVEEFLEKYNSYLLDTYFCQLDEYGDQLTSIRDKEAAKGLLKAYTGSNMINIRDMRESSYSIQHSITFILTANKNPLMMDEEDRRVHLMETPNMLEMQPWYSAGVREAIFKELKDFCYYLATEVEMMTKDRYVSPPKSASKHRLIADSMFAAQKIVYALKHKMYDYLHELALDNNVPELIKELENFKLNSMTVEKLYDELTDFKGDAKTIRKILRKEGFKAVPTTKAGLKAYYYQLDDNPFGDTDE